MLNDNDINYLQSILTFWSDLTNEQKDNLINGSNITHFQKGEILHCSEYECMGILVIKEGMIRTYITSDEGREITLFRLEKNDVCVLSASCILSAIDFDISIDAVTDCDIIQINPVVFSKLSAENIHVELYTYKLSTERFSDVMWAMQQILFTSFDKRLATFLLDEANRTNSTAIHMTHEEIAKSLGSAREVVSRMLKYFSKEGLVTLSRGNITITDKKKMLSFCSK